MTDVSSFVDSAGESCDEGSPSFTGSEVSYESLRPLIEGARARGLADAFELIGAGAILLDRGGSVLHLSTHAQALVCGGGAVRVVEGQLVASDARSNQIMERLIAQALSGSACQDVVMPLDDLMPLHVRAVPMPGARDDEAQLLKALLFVSRFEGASSSVGAA